MEAIVLLADWAEAINGKLYIQGGGWSRVTPPVRMPGTNLGLISCALAIRFTVGWDETNIRHDVGVRLLDADGHAVSPVPGQPPVEVKTQLEVGRPPGVTHGSDLDASMALSFHGLPLAPGRYAFVLEIDGEPIKGATFDVL